VLLVCYCLRLHASARRSTAYHTHAYVRTHRTERLIIDHIVPPPEVHGHGYATVSLAFIDHYPFHTRHAHTRTHCIERLIIDHIVTPPEARGHGYATVVVGFLATLAACTGAELVVLALETAAPWWQRLGFRHSLDKAGWWCECSCDVHLCFLFVLIPRWCECSCDVHLCLLVCVDPEVV
jgi:predicted GNAT family acetyltransferase